MPARKSKKITRGRRLLKKLQHWSPALLLSLAANFGFLQLFEWLIVVKNVATPRHDAIMVLLTPGAPQEKSAPPTHLEAIKRPSEDKKREDKKSEDKKREHKKISQKSLPEKLKFLKPPPIKVVQKVDKSEPPAKPLEPAQSSPKVPEPQPIQPQPIQVANKKIDKNEERINNNPQPLQTPQTPRVKEAVPLFRLTRMPKRVEYDPRVLKRFYPKDERDFGKVATVEALILVDEHGDIVDVHIVKSGGASFDAAARKALLSKLVTVQPGYIGDKPVASWVPVPVTFSLTD